MKLFGHLHKCGAHSVAILMAAVFIAGCSSIDCSLENRVLCNMQFVNMDGDSVELTCPLTVVLVRQAGDTVHYINQQSNVSSIDVPLSYVGEEDLLQFVAYLTDTVQVETYVSYTDSTTMEEVVTDTVWADSVVYVPIVDNVRIRKTSEPWFESVDCSPHYNHTIEAVDAETHNFIDHIIVNDPLVTNDPRKKNLYIQLK